MSQKIERARRVLRCIDSDDPAVIRSRVARALLDALGAEFGFFVNYTVNRGRVFHDSFEVVGDEHARKALKPLEGKPGVSAPCWDLWKPRPIEKQHFVTLKTGPVSKEVVMKSEGYRVAYEPFGIEDHARVLLYDGRRFLGWLGLMRGKHRDFDDSELTALNAVIGEISAALAVAADLEERAGAQDLYILFDPDTLRAEWASSRARPWLDQYHAEVDTLLRGFRRNEPASVSTIGGRETRVVALAGDGGLRYHLHVTPARHPRLGPHALLSPRQLEVAEYAAAGATRREIAETLGLSPHTVADHLKETYRRLGIGSRAELATLLADAPGAAGG